MPDDGSWANSDPDQIRATQQLPLLGAAGAEPAELAEEILAAGQTARPAPSAVKRFLGRALMVTGGLLALGVVLYTVDLINTVGKVPRGVVVAGVEVGGLSQAEAEAKLQRELGPSLTQPIKIFAGDVQATLDPVAAGLGVDWPATLLRAGHQPLDPVERIESFFVKRSIGIVTTTDRQALDEAVSALAAEQLNHPPTEGGIGFRPIPGTDGGVTAYPIEPRDGQTLKDITGAARAVSEHWLDQGGVWLSPVYTPVLATSAGVHAALSDFVAPAIAHPVIIHGEGADAQLKPDAIAAALRFTPRVDGRLGVSVDSGKLQNVLGPQLAATEKPGKDAQIVFVDGNPTVLPSSDGRTIDWNATFAPLTDVLTRTEGRDLAVRYRTTPPALTTAKAGALGIDQVIGEYTTGGLSGPAGANVRTMADKVSGAVIQPGQTFSLAEQVGPWEGFLPAPLHEDGTGPQVVGGGVNQFASTLYNAAYLAGLTDAGHTEHSYYLDRYPPGRDAAAIGGDGTRLDLRFTDSLASGVAIQAFSDGQSVTVRIWGTRQYRVASQTSPRRDIIAPPVVQQSGPGCRPFAGSPGFSVTDTRIRYDLRTGVEVGRDIRVVRYAPEPTVVCL